MSLDIYMNDTDTTPSTDSRAWAATGINFEEDFRISSESPAEVILTNIRVPVTNPENIRIAFSEIADVFKGTKVDPPLNTSTSAKKGCSVLVQMTGVGYDSTGTFTGALPYSAHLVLKLPYAGGIEPESVKVIISRLLGSLYETAELTPNTRIQSLVRGALTPKDL